jgi:hypothetical protein
VIFLIWVGFFSVYSATIRNPKTNLCLSCGAYGKKDYEQTNCSIGSPSQTWTLEEGILKCDGQYCLLKWIQGRAAISKCSSLSKHDMSVERRKETHRIYKSDSPYPDDAPCLTLFEKNGKVAFTECKSKLSGKNSQDIYYE